MAERILYTRNDGRWGWRLEEDNGRIIAIDGGQGYESESTAREMADMIVGGHFKGAKKMIIKGIGPERLEPQAATGSTAL
ncbi:DUF1508 domain-containing protein [Sinomonas sp. JGH33]|uniref:DUF1508 domain-containing protein n=1 Tax=Sinomonas terricola TaxID=3110330 RepID=A0ABU5TBM7_9MICC|nr:DUF1508 domain-containing protein [Sinomonas sp. JGH33]MEA5456836.1 DUF1508 domain-containing protein [Sinomonas sp. JGH33]